MDAHATLADAFREITNDLIIYFLRRNGGYEMSPLIGKFCGTEIPTEIISETNMLYVKFVSDQTRSYTGFSIDWDSTTSGSVEVYLQLACTK